MNLGNIQAEQAFNVIGISARTSNAAEMNGANIIGSLWQRFFAENIISQIPNKIDSAILALYYDYATNKDGEYTILIGMRVATLDKIPEGLTALHVPAEQRVVVTTTQGPLYEVVMQSWQHIWGAEDRKELNRSYGVDYELYDERSQDPAHAQVEIHVGIMD